MQKMIPSSALLVYLIVASVAMTSVVHAQIEEVIVTAQKREQNLQDVPISVSVISGSELESQAIPNFEDLASTMPNFNVSKNAIQDTVAIRGISSDSQAGGEQSVGIYVDGIFRGRGVQSRFAFMDVERIEVLRGPQGTLFGKNTIAGALNITSARPTDEFEGNVLVEAGNYSLIRTVGTLNVPVSENLALRGSASYLERDGYLETDADSADDIAGFLSMGYTPTDSLSIFLWGHFLVLFLPWLFK